MNIWEALGLPSNHRPDNKTVQLVKHYADVAEKVKFPCVGQTKKDGVYALIVITPALKGIFGRTGKAFTSVEHLLPKYADGLATGHGYHRCGSVAFVAELCCDCCSLEELSGIVNPNRKKPLTPEQQECISKAYFAVHDMLYLSELVEGVSQRDYVTRYRDMKRCLMDVHLKGHPVACRVLKDEEDALAFSEEEIAKGEEGIVGKDHGAGWLAGRKNEVAWKVVKGVDFDLLVEGVEEGEGKRKGMVANLLCRWRLYGKPDGAVVRIPVDLKGHKDSQRIEWWENPSLIVGQIVHVHALCIGSKGALRLPKAHEVRIDKTEADL